MLRLSMLTHKVHESCFNMGLHVALHKFLLTLQSYTPNSQHILEEPERQSASGVYIQYTTECTIPWEGLLAGNIRNLNCKTTEFPIPTV